MLQGHFVDLSLDKNLVDVSNSLYQTWLFGRGNTAPLFFTISGFILSYLLLKKDPNKIQGQVLKNIKRGAMLLVIGYALRSNLGSLFSGRINQAFFQVDVLHCIGISLIVVSSIIWLFHNIKLRQLTWVITLVLGCSIFITEPLLSSYQFTGWPVFISNYFTQQHGSVFTILPWLGYVFMGSSLSVIWLNTQLTQAFKTGVLILLGLAMLYSSPFFMWCFHRFDITLLKTVAYNNFLFIRLGYVFIIMAVFNAMSMRIKLPNIIQKLASNTLTIYVIHFALLYGSGFRIGLNQLFHHNLTPFWSAISAVLFVLLCCGLTWSYLQLKPTLKYQLRLLKYQVNRFWNRQKIKLAYSK